uniref:Glycosidase n=1 Tax=Desulfomonile tiedjei TaxID=2358 RepID=A0A7C4AS20_9BACT
MSHASRNWPVRRSPANPILTKEQIPYPVETVHNAAAIKTHDEYVLVFRAHRRNGRSILGVARSQDGFRFSADLVPFMTPSTEGLFAEYEEFGVEDPRVTRLGDAYYLTYSAYSRHGVRIGLAKTEDFRSVERIAFITQADCRNVCLFPKKFGDRFARLDRPHTQILPWSIWISYSPDLVHWGDSQVVMKPAPYHWDEMKIGPGAPPIETTSGWLSIYHGVFQTMDGAVYRLGCALHDLDHPERIVGIADDWILQPEDPWEIAGYVHNVVFTCGAIPEEDGTVKIYWGAADTVLCVGVAFIEELTDLCVKATRSP